MISLSIGSMQFELLMGQKWSPFEKNPINILMQQSLLSHHRLGNITSAFCFPPVWKLDCVPVLKGLVYPDIKVLPGAHFGTFLIR